ncbi:DUF4259 domain-containing protein [Streptomyces sp. NPDC088358]|uniref:DUF4259 domain-containing protein n=1 Tax=Streptomyces sp. NPDC088358 TaxID=3365857 RepID=UPI0038192B8B
MQTSPVRSVVTLSVPHARIRTTLRKEISMGPWDTGPFGDDTAADFANALDDAEPESCEALIRGVLVRTVVATGFLREADEAVAAAALIAAQCLGGEPVDTPYGPETSMPVFPSDLRTLADEALTRIASDEARKLARARERTAYVHDFERRSVSRGRVSRLLTNRPLSKRQVLAHPRRKNQYRQTDTAQQVYAGGCPEERGGSVSPRCPEAMLSPSPFPRRFAARVPCLGSCPERRSRATRSAAGTTRPGPNSGLLVEPWPSQEHRI